MPLLNYTTKIDARKTVAEIQSILGRKGVCSVSVEYGTAGTPTGITFMIEIAGHPVDFRLPSNHAGVWAAMRKDRSIPPRMKDEEQAARVAWRIVKDWTEAQMAIIEAGIATIPQVFMPYALTDTGRTLYEVFEAQQGRLLTTGSNGKG